MLVFSGKDIFLHSRKGKLKWGGLAHLVERKHGMFEVIGSSPISSTQFKNPRIARVFCFIYYPFADTFPAGAAIQ